jgi:hypothetical protein
MVGPYWGIVLVRQSGRDGNMGLRPHFWWLDTIYINCGRADGVTWFRTTACRLVGELGKTGCGSKELGRRAVPKEARDEHRTRIFLAGSRFCTYFKG